MHREAGRVLGEERNVLTAPSETSSFAEVPSAGAALRTRLRAQRNRARFRGCRRTGARRGGSQEVDAGPIWERVTSGADEWRDRAKTAAPRRKRAVRFAARGDGR